MAEKVGYVLKIYPRFSETFIVTEILALERLGAEIEIVSLRSPHEGRFHPALADVRAAVAYPSHTTKPETLWRGLKEARSAFGAERLEAHLGALLDLPAADAAQTLEVAKHLQGRGCTRLHAHFGTVATEVARISAGLLGIPYTFTAHAKDIFHEDVDAEALTRRARGAETVVTVSEYNKRWLEAHHGPARVEVVYNGIDLTRFAYEAPTARPRRIAAVGRLVEKKGFDVLLQACELLKRRGTQFECVLAGTGVQEQALREQAARLGLGDVLEFAGPLPQTRVVELVTGSAAFAAPCVVAGTNDRDGLPTVLLESMALGTPVVSTPVTGIPEAVVDGTTGLLVPERDPEALADALELLLEDEEERTRLSREARRLVEERFDASKQAEHLGRILGVT